MNLSRLECFFLIAFWTICRFLYSSRFGYDPFSLIFLPFRGSGDLHPLTLCVPQKQSTLQLRYVNESDSDMPTVARWDGRVHWTIKGCSVFDNQQEEAGALLNRANFLRLQSLSNHWVFQYGLRYIPSEQETNVYRTVRIEDLPTDTTLEYVIRLVPGNIYSARLFDTVAITGHNTMIIIFVEEQDAREFVRLAKGNLDIGSNLATVSLVNTPTYPMSPEMDKLIKRGHSRCVVVSNLGTSTKQDLAHVIDKSAYHSYVERMEDGPLEGHVSIRFHCIRSASDMSTHLKGHPMFWNCTVSFLNETEEDLVLTEA